ncbi:MAG: hypothetical protein HZB59_00370 [Ignavibacteriales bacterium]|nr:hypothetical protein [Ignavibacteriales bacterium]
MRVYLSGGMEYADGEGVNWRKEMQEWLQTKVKHSVFNPNVESDIFFADRYPNIDFREIKRTNTGLYQEIVRHLVDIDCKEIANHSDYVICYWDEGAAKGAGTKGELTMARYFNKPVYLVTSYQLHDIPGWVLGCTSNIFKNFEELKQFLSKK